MTTLRLAMRASSRGVMRPIAEFEQEAAREIAMHAAAIAALSPGCQWGIQTTMGRTVDVAVPAVTVAPPVVKWPPLPVEPVVIAPPVAPEPPPEPPKTSVLAGLWALIRGR